MRVNIPQKLRLLAFALFFAMCPGATRAVAQDATPSPPPSPESEEVTRLTEEEKIQNLRSKIAAERKAELDARFPNPSTTPLAGTTTINDGAVIESQMISYLSMAYAANRIVDRLKDVTQCREPEDSGECPKLCKIPGHPGQCMTPPRVTIKSLAIYNKADLDLLLNYRALNSQLEILHQEYCKMLPAGTTGCAAAKAAPLAGLSIAESFLGAFVDLTALLRTNVTIQGQTFSIEEASLVSEVFRAMKAPDGYGSVLNLYYPAAFPPNLNADSKSELLERLEALNNLRLQGAKVEELLKQVVELKEKIKNLSSLPKQIKTAQDELDRLERIRRDAEAKGWRVPFSVLERIEKLRETIQNLQATDTSGLQPAKDQLTKITFLNVTGNPDIDKDKLEETLRNAISKFKSVSDRIDQLIATLTKTEASTGINAITAYLRAEQIKSALGDDGAYWLQLAVVKAGGNNRIKTNLIVDIFTGGNRISHSGGVIVQYNLYDPSGKSLASDTLTEYTGYIKADKVKRLGNPFRVDEVPQRNTTLPK